MNNKRILFIEHNTDGTIGGSYFSLLFLVERLNKNKYSPVTGFYQEHQLIPEFKRAGCKVLLFKKSKRLNLLGMFPVMEKLSHNRIMNAVLVTPLLLIQKAINYFTTFVFPAFGCWMILKKEKIDLIHLNNTMLRPQEWILASLFTRARVIAHERGINNVFPFQTLYWIRFLRAIICISRAVKDNLLNHGLPGEKLFMIHNGLDPDKFKVSKSREEVLRDFGINSSTPVIGMVGNIKYWKGQMVVVKAMKHILKELPDTKCFLIGGMSDYDKEYFDNIKKIINENELNGSIIFTGQRSDVPDLINSLSVLVHSSILPEPFGRVLLEGMALSKPVITTSIGAGPEIVEDGKTGLVVNADNEEDLANAVLSLLKDNNKAIKMGRAGRLRLEQYFHISANIKKTEELYSKLLHT